MASQLLRVWIITRPLLLVFAAPGAFLPVGMQQQARHNKRIVGNLVPSGRDELIFSPRGVSGGGSFFSPALHPFNSSQLWVSSDMSGLYRSVNAGKSFNLVRSRYVVGGRPCQVQFSNISGTLFAIDRGHLHYGSWLSARPVRSTDNGATWTPLAVDPTNGTTKSLHASPFHAGRLILSDFSRVFFSDDGGSSWVLTFHVSRPSNVFVAGVHFPPVDHVDHLAFVGTNHGLLVVSQSTRAAANLGLLGIAQDSAMFAFTGATNVSSGCTRLCCIVAPRNSSQFARYQFDEEGFDKPTGVFQLNFGDSAAGVSWEAMHDSLPRLAGNGGSAGLTNVAMSATDPSTIYLAGKRVPPWHLPWPSTQGNLVLRLVDAVQTDDHGRDSCGVARGVWRPIFNGTLNHNVNAGWLGAGGRVWAGHVGGGGGSVFDWDWTGGSYGLTVAAGDSRRLAFGDSGVFLVSNDAGKLWRDVSCRPSEQSIARAPISHGGRAVYHSNGLQPTTCWSVAWADKDHLFASYTDLKGLRSTDGGMGWSFNFTGHTQNTMYHAIVDDRSPAQVAADGSISSTLYAATSDVHDMFSGHRLTDAQIDHGDANVTQGSILRSHDLGASFELIHEFGMPVVWLALGHAHTLYASVVNRTNGGVFACDISSDQKRLPCRRLATPPRTQGRANVCHVLVDGSIVCSYSARLDDELNFTASSGVFILKNPARAGTQWLDVSHPSMHYYTKDVIVDPTDPAHDTWYAAVAVSWGKVGALPGGLYRTTNRGKSWDKMPLALERGGVESAVVQPTTGGNSVFVSTEQEGLWHCCLGGGVRCSRVDSYPFWHPLRCVFNPHDTEEFWVTSFGGGMYTARVSATIC